MSDRAQYPILNTQNELLQQQQQSQNFNLESFWWEYSFNSHEIFNCKRALDEDKVFYVRWLGEFVNSTLTVMKLAKLNISMVNP